MVYNFSTSLFSVITHCLKIVSIDLKNVKAYFMDWIIL